MPTPTRFTLLGLCLIVVGCGNGVTPTVAPRPVVIESPVSLQTVGTALYPGVVVAREESPLGFRIGGKLMQRRVDVGQKVEPGDTLAEIDPEDARLAVNAANAAVRAAEADASLAEAEMKRFRQLLDRGFVGASAFELQENRWKLADARLKQVRAEAAVTRNQSQYTRLMVDRPGLITAVLAEPGQVLQAGQPVLRFVPEEGLEVEIQVPEGRVDALQAAGALPVRIWAVAGLELMSQIREIAPQADPLTRTHRVRLQLTEADPRVRLGMTVNVRRPLASDRPVFGISSSALGDRFGQPTVWRVGEDGIVQPIEVEVVRYTEQGAVIAAALSEADALVSAGVHLLTPGQQVRTLPRLSDGG